MQREGTDMFLSILSRKHEEKLFRINVEQGIEKFLNYTQMEVDSEQLHKVDIQLLKLFLNTSITTF